MALKFLLVLCAAALPLVAAKSDRPKYRMEKINFVWEKAAAQLQDQLDALKRLAKDLDTFDGLYLGLKQDAHHKPQHGGDGAEKIDSKLEALLQRYDLEDTIYAFRMKYKYDTVKIYTASPTDTQKQPHAERTFDDPRLALIWDSVKEDRSFSLGDLDGVFYELENHAQKLDDYRQLLQHAEEIAASNHVKQRGAEGEEGGEEGDEEGLLAVKQISASLDKDLQRLQKRVKDIKANPFKLVRVRRLWEKAFASKSLVPNELEAIKTELRHFERHVELSKHRGEQLAAREADEFHWHDADAAGDSAAAKEHHEKLERKLKKLEHYLDEKISGGGGAGKEHSEL